MRVGVLADTHLYAWPPEMLAKVRELMADVELILHAGDIVNPHILDLLPAPVVAVCGNSDSAMVAARLPARRLLCLGGVSLGLCHGYGPPEGLMERARAEFPGARAVVFGHSHIACAQSLGGVFMFNPGSLTRSRRGGGSLGILELGEGAVNGGIIRI